ncbi:MAG: polysaccharide biosynthesis/export family protein, partial [Myxococcota bacterium]
MLITLLTLVGIAADPAAASSYQVGPGDTLRLEVYGEDELSRDLVINAGCRIDVPLIGGQEVCGLTTEQIASQLQTEL